MTLEETARAPSGGSRKSDRDLAKEPVVGADNKLGQSEIIIDPQQIQKPSQIPPGTAQFAGRSSQGIVDVYCGTLLGDVDARPAARELLGTSLDTGGLSNADYIYNQVLALYGKTPLPSFQSPSGDDVKSVVFVSGSIQGGYGAFHIPGTQEEFDRIVVDSLNCSGSYSAGSGLAATMFPMIIQVPHLFSVFRGAGELLVVLHHDDPRMKVAMPTAIHEALATVAQSTLALKSAVEARNASLVPRGSPVNKIRLPTKDELPQDRRLAHANQEVLGLLMAAARAGMGRQYLSTALFAAEIVESFQKLTGKADPKHTDGEAVSRVLSYKLAPEIALVPGFNNNLTQQWWKDGHPDFVNVNSEDDQSIDGNAAGVMFLEFLTDYLGVPMDQIIKYMPSTGGAPLGNTYSILLSVYSDIGQAAGPDGSSAFQKMVSLIEQNAQNPDGSLNLPADGNPFVGMPGSKQGGLFAGQISDPGSLARDAQSALGLEVQLDQQVTALKSTLQQIPSDLSGQVAMALGSTSPPARDALVEEGAVAFGYGPQLVGSLVSSLDQRVSPYRAPSYDQTLQHDFWPHVYNELPDTGPNTDRLQVITGTNQVPLAVQVIGTITQTKPEPDGDLHIRFQPDDPNFPTNQGAGESPLEIEVIYAGPVRQPDAKQAEQGYTNPFDISQLTPGTRVLAAGPLIFDRAHGKPTPDGNNVETGLEIHPLAGVSILSDGGTAQPPSPAPSPMPGPSTNVPPAGQLSADLASAIGQLGTLNQTVGNLTSLLQKMKGEAPPS